MKSCKWCTLDVNRAQSNDFCTNACQSYYSRYERLIRQAHANLINKVYRLDIREKSEKVVDKIWETIVA